jgi:hypothetical protein
MYSALLRIGIVLSLISLAFLCNVGRRSRNGLVRAPAEDPRLTNRPSRFIRDLRPLQDLLVKFVAALSTSAGIVSVLPAHRKPLPLMGMVREVSVEQDRPGKGYVLATSIAWAVLSILLVPCLTRVDRRGFVITKVGREDERWIETDSATSAALADGQGPTLSPLPSRTKTLLYNAAL